MSASTVCGKCPCRTPFIADPDVVQRGKELVFEPPLDEGIREIVLALIAHGVDTYESCQGGEGHGSPVPFVRFEGGLSEGPRAFSVAVAYGLPVANLMRVWSVDHDMLHGPWWEMTFIPSRPSA
jgi:hypothetical protein